MTMEFKKIEGNLGRKIFYCVVFVCNILNKKRQPRGAAGARS
jgi:hypothetical protein